MKNGLGIFVTVLLAALLILTACSKNNPVTGDTVADQCLSLEGSAKDNCYLNAGQCSKIENPQARDSCVAELAKKKNDLAVCDLVVDGKTKAFCQEQIAVQKNDPEMCKNIKDSYWQDNCYYHVAINLKDFDKCAYVSEVSQNLDCVKKVAIASNNAELCGRLSATNKAECIVKIATQTMDATVCAQFKDNTGTGSVNASACYLKIAKLSGKKEICDSINIKQIKQSCVDYFAAKK